MDPNGDMAHRVAHGVVVISQVWLARPVPIGTGRRDGNTGGRERAEQAREEGDAMAVESCRPLRVDASEIAGPKGNRAAASH